jgi:hypothetical protein
MIKMKAGSTVFFGCAPQYLDPYSLTYRWFGAVWRYEADLKMVEGFWFSTQKEDFIEQVKAKWENWSEVTDPIEIKSIYEGIRNKQKQQDWKKRSLLSLKSVFSWRGTKSGWYILRSDLNFPFYISVIKKNRFFAWIIHADICESAADVNRFIENVNREHNIKIKLE